MSDDRTEKPTGKKLSDAREKGQIARSKELAVAAGTLAGVMALGRLGERLMQGLGERLAADLSHIGDHVLRPVTAGDLHNLVVGGGALLAVLVGPIALATMVAAVFVQVVQGGWIFAPAALELNWGRLNPVNGMKRFGLMQAGADTLKTMLAVVAIVWASWGAVQAVMNDGVRLAWMSPMAAAGTAWDYTESMLWKVAWALAFLAIGDYALQRHRLMSSLKMTKQEIKDEAKNNEGNPEVKGRIRRIQREMIRRRMLGDVKRATVVITNPTHFAVALEYRRGSMAAPIVLAKGQDHLAAAIREQARLHGVPMVENKPLAQALYRTAEVGEAIPANLFAAVAEVLAQLIRLKQLVL